MNNFSVFVPIDIFEKGKRDLDGLPEELLISGVASSGKSNKYDLDGQFLDVNGYDYAPFLKSGFLNLEHLGRQDYSNIVGEPTNAFVKDNEFHIEGKLYKDNPKAVSIYKLGQMLKKSGSSRKIGYSIEGHAVEKDPSNPNRITKAKITGCAITISPKNDGTQLFFKGGKEGVEYEVQEGSDMLIDIVQDGIHATVDKDLNINLNVEKAIIAGESTGRDTTDQSLTQEPLKKESVDGGHDKKKKKKLLKKEIFSKGELYMEIFSIINLDVDSAKLVYELTERIQKSLTPMADTNKVSQEAFQKALETLNLVPEVVKVVEEKKTEPTAEELAKAEIDSEIKKAEDALAVLKAKAAAPVVVEAKKEEAGVVVKSDEFNKAVIEEKLSAIGVVALRATEESSEVKAQYTELKKAVDTLVGFNKTLAEKLGMIEALPLERKSVPTAKAIERFSKGEGDGAAAENSGVRVMSMSNKKDKAVLADELFKAAVASGIDENGKPKDQEFMKAVQYLELGSFPNETFAKAIQTRLLRDQKIRLVK